MEFNKKIFNVKTLLNLVAIIVTVSMFLKSVIDVDRSYDSWWYHLPFAARIWGIVPAISYAFQDFVEARYDGFPLLAQFLQGLFWVVFQRVQAANLVSFLSLIIYICFLKYYFKVPLYLSAIALLAVPMIQIHATSCYVDLPANVCLSILILMTYLIYTQRGFLTKRNLFVIFLAATGTANIKMQLIPVVLLILCFVGFKLIWLGFKEIKARRMPSKSLLTIVPAIFLAALLIFATPMKNIVFYGNPFYPLRIEIMGIVLNHKELLYQDSPDYLKNASRPQRWVYSVLEINSAPWSIDQGSKNPSQHRMGGFFGAYVIFNILLFSYICYRYRSRETLVAAILVIIMSLVAAFIPQSHELRYYMFWMISLVSLNLYLVCHLERSPKNLKWLDTKNLGIICVLFLTLVIFQIRKPSAVKPSFYTFEKHLERHVDFKLVNKISPAEEVCIISITPNDFLYASKFHPQLNYSYSVKATDSESECGVRKAIKPAYRPWL
ncbi:hypothetical protein [Microseira sp. BLCC-F43]|jgi:hypothetical protein|uniref:hypothetical protein n=1 Tax=Microseira sp. BLCC-F43 TaxID=3153602 RepID=UPI0035B725C5